MKIKIPDQYKNLFTKKLFLSYWKNKTILVLSGEEKELLMNKMKELLVDENRGLNRFLEAGITEVIVKDGEFEIPEHLVRFTGSTHLTLNIEDKKIIIK